MAWFKHTGGPLLAFTAGILGIAEPGRANLIITPTFDATITSDLNSATIMATINSAISAYQTNFSDGITVNITFKEDSSISLGQSSTHFNTITYAQLRAALVTDSKTTTDTTVLANLPGTTNNPVNGSTLVNLMTANLRAIGRSEGNLSVGTPDSTISLNTGLMNLSRPDADPNKYDLFAVVSHEIDEALGMYSSLNGLANGAAAPTGAIFVEDLFRYDSSGARSFTTNLAAQAFFSIDGTNRPVQYNQIAGADFQDWASSGTVRIQDAFGTAGATPVLGVELTALDAIGYDLVSTPEPGTFFLLTSALGVGLYVKRRRV